MDEFPQQAPIRGAPNSAAYLNGEQPKRAHLYVGGISPRVTEYMLQITFATSKEIFGVAGPVIGVKIIPDRNFQHGGANYGFVEFQELRSAETALQTLNGRKIFDNEIKVMWAYQNQASAPKEDLAGHYHVFCGDLSPEVTDEVLRKAFVAFGSLSDARCMWDMNTGKSRGYGFLAFRDKTDAEQAIATMNGEWLGTKAIRVNWANSKNGGQPGAPSASPMGASHGATSAPASVSSLQVGSHWMKSRLRICPHPKQYDQVVSQAPSFNSTIYVGNLVPFASQADLIPLFQGFGYIVEIRMQADRGFAFVKLDTHENAAKAIINLTGTNVHGRPLRCSWGKDKSEGGPGFGGSAGSASPAHIGSPQPYQQARPQPGLAQQPYMYAQQPYAQAQQPYGTYSAQPQPQQQPQQHQQQQAPQDPAAAAAAMAAWQAQYGAQYAAYMQQQAALQHQHYQTQQQHAQQPPHHQGGRPQ
ncbi:BQ2448_3084 [Microbotryum intermedium]|uniref:BQ2448_3084 protein n=1 Tax=Microbotryum intermedium TaxID=269621 RepID=A0A238FK94_9BASI|nr:BQ2448_3084 [Microbotryum intermedium]